MNYCYIVVLNTNKVEEDLFLPSEALLNGWIRFIMHLPKSSGELFGLKDSSDYLNNLSYGYDLTVMYSEKISSYGKTEIASYIDNRVVILFVQSEKFDTQSLGFLDGKKVILVYIGDNEAFKSELEQCLNSKNHMFPKDVCLELCSVGGDTKLENYYSSNVKEISCEKIIRGNLLNQFPFEEGSYVSDLKLNPDKPILDKRVEVMERSILDLYKKHSDLFPVSDWDTMSMLPPLFILQPYINAKFYKLKMRNSQEIHGMDREVFRYFKMALYKEQSYADYSYHIAEGINNEKQHYGFGMGASILAGKRDVLDNMAFLHASVHRSPILRLPQRGKSIDQAMHYFKPGNYDNTSNFKKLNDNLDKVGKCFLSGVDTKTEELIKNTREQIVCISDLPVEWLRIKNVPLFLTNDVCRMMETTSSSLMASYCRGGASRKQIDINILKKTMVVCLSPKDENINNIFEVVKGQCKSSESLQNIKFLSTTCKDELKKEIDNFKPEFLIIDTHGKYRKEELDSYLSIGEDKLTGDDVVSLGISAPIVFLSCCFSAPLFGYVNPIPQAFFEAGAQVVVSTVLPVNINKATSLYFRILNNFHYCLTHKIHPNLLNFFSHVIRTSYFEDLILDLKANIYDEDFSLDVFSRGKVEWLMKMIKPDTRLEAIENISIYVKKCFHEKHSAYIDNYLQEANLVYDSYYYSILGRADLISLKVDESGD